MTVRIDGQPRGTRVMVGDQAARFEGAVRWLEDWARKFGAKRVYLPALDAADRYVGRPGERMGVTGPSAQTILCPERTDQCRRLASHLPEGATVYYVERCYRLERPQAGRWREFTQFGVEMLTPTDHEDLIAPFAYLAAQAVSHFAADYRVVKGVPRGLSYYTGPGFEIECPSLGAQKQVCGGGAYPEGLGFAIGVDRLMLAMGADARD